MGCRVGLRIVLFEDCSAFTRVTARTLALPPIRGTLIRRLQPFRFLHSCSGCFRLEQLPGGTHTHWKTPPYHGAHPKTTLTTVCQSSSKSPPLPPSRPPRQGAFLMFFNSASWSGRPTALARRGGRSTPVRLRSRDRVHRPSVRGWPTPPGSRDPRGRGP